MSEAPAPDPWADAAQAAALLAVDPGLGGVHLRARSGPVRDAWIALATALAPGGRLHRLPPGAGDEALYGGLDLAATLAAGRPVRQPGLLERVGGGTLAVPMAERMTDALSARLAQALDGMGAPACILLDEGAEADERSPARLTDRLALHLRLDDVRHAGGGPEREAIAAARTALPGVTVPDALVAELTGVAVALGIGSLRAPLLALRVARAAAALAGLSMVDGAAARLAVRLVLAPRATRLPPVPDAQAEAPAPPSEAGAQEATGEGKDEGADEARDEAAGEADRLVEEARAALPPDILAALIAGTVVPRGPAATGGAGARRRTPTRGRPAGTARGRPGGGVRLDLIATLRAAAPWQTIRRALAPGRSGVAVRADDFRVRRFTEAAESTLILVVDASGSAALARLGEAKGAVSLILAEAYVRRESVALIAFRGTRADLVLPPTRSLVQAKRRLASLPGGGGTPLAAGLLAAGQLAAQVRARGATPFLVILTDGRGNVALDGSPGRPGAAADTERVARSLAALRTGALLIDTAQRPQAEAASLARALGARYLALPRADATGLSRAVRLAQEGA